jgi:hypothetical protein
MPGKEPVEQGRPCPPDVQETRWARWKTGSNLAHFLPSVQPLQLKYYFTRLSTDVKEKRAEAFLFPLFYGK